MLRKTSGGILVSFASHTVVLALTCMLVISPVLAIPTGIFYFISLVGLILLYVFFANVNKPTLTRACHTLFSTCQHTHASHNYSCAHVNTHIT